MAHCPSYKLPAQITPSLESRGRENSSVIMIPLHARRLLRAVLSAGSQHFSSFSPTQITYAEREVKAVLMLPPGQRGPWLVHVSSVLSGHFSFF